MDKKEEKDMASGTAMHYALEAAHEYWVDIHSREIWIHGENDISPDSYDGEEPGVEYMMATKVIKNLHLLRKISHEPVTIHLHTCGGLWEEGMAIYDNIRMMPYHVTMISHTHARSMSSIILQAADRRLLMPSSYFLIHRGTLEVGGEARQVESIVEYAAQQTKVMVELYCDSVKTGKKYKGKSRREIRKAINAIMDNKVDVFMSPEEAIQWGFADGIATAEDLNTSW